MIIYLMRHADAVPPMFWTKSDSTRPLTDLAQAQLVGTSLAMKKMGFKPQAILSSPFERAKETAHLLTESLLDLTPLTVPELASGARPQDYQDALIPFNNKEEVLVVGHMPEVSVVASRLTGDAQLMDQRFSPGDMVAIEMPSVGEWGSGKVIWKRKLDDWKTL